jgi:opacity protein-like surface antigen
MFRKLFIFTLTLLVVSGVCAQKKNNYQPPFSNEMVAFSWGGNVPINNDFTNKTSWNGFKLEYRKMIKPDLSVGFEMSWNGFEQYRPTKTYQLRNGAVTTDFYSYMYTVPVALNAHHYFHFNDMVTPFAGLALGATYSEEKLYYNIYGSNYYNWGFLISPELGAIVKFEEGSGFGIIVGVNYNYSTNKQSQVNLNGIQNFGFQVGIMLGK